MEKEEITLKEFFWNTYLPYANARKVNVAHDVSTFKSHIDTALGHLTVSQLERRDLDDWLTCQMGKGLKKSTVNKHIFLLNRMLKLSERWGYLPRGGFYEIKLEKIPLGDFKQRFLTPGEIKRILDASVRDQNPFIHSLIKLLILTGARVGEARKARWLDLSFDTNKWHVPVAKGGRSRTIYLNSEATKTFREIRMIALSLGLPVRPENYILTNPKTNTLFNSFYSPWYRVMDRADLSDIRIHDLRHTYASILINNGVTIYEVQKLLGHSTVNITQRYAHLYPDHLHQKAENVSSYIREVC